MSTTSAVIAADLFPLKQRGLVGAISTAIWAIGGALGGPIGGWAADTWGWRSAFTCEWLRGSLLRGTVSQLTDPRAPVQVPLLVGSLISGLVHIHYPVASARTESAREKLARIDFAGVATLFLAFGSFLVSLSLRQNERLPVR